MTRRLRLRYDPDATFMGHPIGDLNAEEARGALAFLAKENERLRADLATERDKHLREMLDALAAKRARQIATACRTIPVFRASED